MRRLLYLVIRDGKIISAYTSKRQAKDDMNTRNGEVLMECLEENKIADPELKDLDDICYDADGFNTGTIDITNIDFDADTEEEIMIETLEGGDVFSIDEIRPFVN